MKILLGYIFTYLYLIFVITIITFLKKKCNLKGETSRKLIHILVGFCWLIMIYYFKNSYHLIIPPFTFILINYISYKKDLISSMESRNKESKGTIYYALSFTILASITVIKKDFLPFYGLGVLTMTLGDGLAPLIGKKFPKYKITKNKTIAGSLTVLITAMLLTIAFNHVYILNLNIIKIIIIGISALLLELIGKKGLDNITLPIGVALISYYLV